MDHNREPACPETEPNSQRETGMAGRFLLLREGGGEGGWDGGRE